MGEVGTQVVANKATIEWIQKGNREQSNGNKMQRTVARWLNEGALQTKYIIPTCNSTL